MGERPWTQIATVDDLEKKLKSRIFGQNHIVEEVVNTLKVSMAGLSDESKPIASFLFTGPTGVGKTEFAIELAKNLGVHFERFDMSEYADEYSARNLTGGQKGLVGYEDGGLLTNAVKENPECVLLLDEIEKADRAVYNTFLQVLDYGTLKDTQGNTADFTKTVIIMTSNLGSNEKRGIGFADNTDIYKESAVADFLSPEFRNRLDNILEFNKLTGDMIIHITDKFLEDLGSRLLEKNIFLSISGEAKEHLNTIGFESAMGARSISRAINSEFKRHISQEILFGSLKDGGTVCITLGKDGFVYDFRSGHRHTDVPEGIDAGCDFKTAEEACRYAKENVGVTVTKSPSGHGYIIKDRHTSKKKQNASKNIS